MGDRFFPVRVHVVVGAPWKDAVISFLEPRSPYRPWPDVPDARQGDGVVVVFGCEPKLVLTDIARVDADDDVGHAIAALGLFRHESRPIPASRVGAGLNRLPEQYTLLEGTDAVQLVRTLEDHRFDAEEAEAFGHSSMAAARVLLDSGGRCSGCGADLDLQGDNARDGVAVWTVDSPERTAGLGPQPADWPAALCARCQSAFSESRFETFLDYRFSRYPRCPRCGARRTQRAVFGMLAADTNIAPWQDARGCCVSDDVWTCSRCHHQWGAQGWR